MTTEQQRPYKFSFFPPDRSEEFFDFDMTDVGLRFRRSRSGLLVMTFPEPYQSLELTEGERLGVRKWARVKEAIAFLKGGVK